MGRALGRLLRRRGLRPLGISCRTMRSARRAAAHVGAGLPTTSNTRAAEGADLLLVTTPDRVVPRVARQLAASGIALRGRVVAHTSGVLSSSALEPLRRRGALAGSLHPLASVTGAPDAEDRLRGASFVLEGDPAAVRTLRRLVLRLGGTPVVLPGAAKALHHFIASLLSNDLVALLSLGLDAARGLGLDPRRAAGLYLPLARGTVENVTDLGPVAALTGPISRGDAATLRLHAAALGRLPADLRRLHRILGRRAIRLALAARTITPGTATRLGAILRSAR